MQSNETTPLSKPTGLAEPNGILARSRLIELGIPAVIAVMCVFFALKDPSFFTVSNFQSISLQISVLAIIAIGQTLALLMGGMDLSVGSVVGISGMVAALTAAPLGVPTAMLLGVLTGAMVGALNGVIIARLRAPAFIATLGMLSVARGATYVISDGRPITDVPASYGRLAAGSVGPVPTPVVIVAALFIIFQMVLALTPFGRRIYSVGVNSVAARLSGVRVVRVQFLVYVLSGLLAGIGGIVLSSRTVSGQATAGAGFELQVIAAVVLGGVSFFGGRGSLWRAMVGVIFIGLLGNGLNMVNVSPYTQMVIIGLALMAALAVDQLLRGRQRERWQ